MLGTKKDKKKLVVIALLLVGVIFVSGCIGTAINPLDLIIKILGCLFSPDPLSCLLSEGVNAISGTTSFAPAEISANSDIISSEFTPAPNIAYTRQFVDSNTHKTAYWIDSNNKIAAISITLKTSDAQDKISTLARQRGIRSLPANQTQILVNADKTFLKDTANGVQYLNTNFNNVGLTEEQKLIIKSQDVKFRAEDAGTEIKLTFESSGKIVVLWADKSTHKIISVGEKAGQIIAQPVQGPISATPATT